MYSSWSMVGMIESMGGGADRIINRRLRYCDDREQTDGEDASRSVEIDPLNEAAWHDGCKWAN